MARPGGGAKRARRDKGLVVEFDETKRREFLTGFRKRKNQRRKAGAMQQQAKERKKKLAARQESIVFASQRRLLRKQALGLQQDPESSHDPEEVDDQAEGDNLEETVVYEDDQTRTVVNTCPIEDSDVKSRARPSGKKKTSHKSKKIQKLTLP
ncbi:ribosomal RNA-processing protein 17 isoform X1 [Selaginella moellendorffii]|uniref:ribosomal RNA-processing protein 17 isoform X1 n=1 Tax=Selaginella moellendorffii TaxID=88036 RepID=UPI000D1D0B4A|nr:ribosomal RNA-processing protein 17 isoform X1 [Selaginella moellendorffii]|eukprot:XP_024542684.1 ribosomal RNA-processing protein 17 isoform X1 [Selaginella moellendorffii]